VRRVSPLAYAGLRPAELTGLMMVDYDPAGSTLRVGAVRSPRTIRIARSAAEALDAYLAVDVTEPDETLLMGLHRAALREFLFRASAVVGVSLRSHDLRKAAIGAAVAARLPRDQVTAYFGFSAGRPAGIVPVQDGGAAVAAVLERAFSGEVA
jgi:integrase